MLPKRIYMLDIARGVATLSVVLWHWQHFFYDKYQLTSTFDRSQQPFYYLFSLFYKRGGYLAVDFFFLLSGFIFFWLYPQKIANRECTFVKFIILRISKLYPLHIATLLSVMLLQNIHISATQYYFVFPNNDMYHFFLHLFFASHWGLEYGHSFNAPVWFVSISIGIYLLFFLLSLWKRTNWQNALIIVLASFLLQFLNIGGRWPHAIEAFFIGGLTFHVVYWYIPKRNKTLDFGIILTASLLWSSLALSDTANIILHNNIFHIYLIILFPITIVALVILELKFTKIGKRFSWIGNVSYTIYLLHFPLQLTFALIALKLNLTKDVFYSPVSLILFLVILLLSSLATYHLFEIPKQKCILKWYLSLRNI